MNSYEESKFFYLSSLTVILFNIFFIGFILKNGHKEYIPPAGVITFEYWNELVKNPELVDEVLASNVANISSVSCIIFVLEILYALAVYDSLRSRDGRWILLIVPIAFISYKICRQLFITYIPVYHMFMLLLPTEFISIVLEVLNLYAYRRSRIREMLKNSTHR